jgi:cell wall-associated NlpC family hydrolase
MRKVVLFILFFSFFVLPDFVNAEIAHPYVVDEKPRVLFGDSAATSTYYGLENYTHDYVGDYAHFTFTYTHSECCYASYPPSLYVTNIDPRATTTPLLERILAPAYHMFPYGDIATDWYLYNVQFDTTGYTVVVKQAGVTEIFNSHTNVPGFKASDWVALANQYPTYASLKYSMAFTPVPILNALPSLSNLNQYKSDDTIIPEGQTVDDSAVTFKTLINDPGNGQVKFQVELKKSDQTFDESGLIESGLVSSGATANVATSSLADGKYHWRARAIDEYGNKSDWQEFGTAGNIDFEVQTSLVSKAVAKAKAVVGGNYTFGAKGFNWQPSAKGYLGPEQVGSKIFNYTYWNSDKNGTDNSGQGVDCSGLSMWSYNSSYNLSQYKSLVKYESADGQYYNNTTPIEKGSEQPGDLMFFNWDGATHKSGSLKGLPVIEHVAMYTGPFMYNGSEYNVAEARNRTLGIMPSKKEDKTDLSTFVSFGRINDPRIALSVKTASPIDLTVTDPDGITISTSTITHTDEEMLHEIPGELYYSIYDIEPDGTPKTEVYSPQLKPGDYIIKPFKRADAPAGAVYSITVNTGAGPLTVANNTSVDSIPQNGYGVTVNNSQIANTFVPVSINIKPDSINLKSEGVISVAIFGSATLDVKKIDISSIKLGSTSVKSKNNNQLAFSYSDLNADGFTDVIVKISRKALGLSATDVKISLEGQLIDGTIIKGSNGIKIVP